VALRADAARDDAAAAVAAAAEGGAKAAKAAKAAAAKAAKERAKLEKAEKAAKAKAAKGKGSAASAADDARNDDGPEDWSIESIPPPRVQIVEMLVAAGADLDAADAYGNTALINASWQGE